MIRVGQILETQFGVKYRVQRIVNEVAVCAVEIGGEFMSNVTGDIPLSIIRGGSYVEWREQS